MTHPSVPLSLSYRLLKNSAGAAETVLDYLWCCWLLLTSAYFWRITIIINLAKIFDQKLFSHFSTISNPCDKKALATCYQQNQAVAVVVGGGGAIKDVVSLGNCFCLTTSICLKMLVVTFDKLMGQGLLLMQHNHQRQANVGRPELLCWFKTSFGEAPTVFANLWDYLQTTNIANARVEKATMNDLKKFQWAIHFLFDYNTESALTGLTGWCDKTIQKHVWDYVAKISALKKAKIVWPEAWDN